MSMSDNQTLRDHLADIINERNDLLRQIERLKQRIDQLTEQYSALWKVSDPEVDRLERMHRNGI